MISEGQPGLVQYYVTSTKKMRAKLCDLHIFAYYLQAELTSLFQCKNTHSFQVEETWEAVVVFQNPLLDFLNTL